MDGEVVTDWHMEERYDLIHTREGYARAHEPKELLARELKYEVELFNADKSTGIDTVRTNNPEKALRELKEKYENGNYDVDFV